MPSRAPLAGDAPNLQARTNPIPRFLFFWFFSFKITVSVIQSASSYQNVHPTGEIVISFTVVSCCPNFSGNLYFLLMCL